MKFLLKHIIPLFVVVFASCGKDEAKVISRGKMAEIYAQMLMTDQWISSTPGMRMIADTSLVYEPILEKYGYDHLDYLKSVDHYMNDPERFSRILRTSGELLDKHIKDLKKRQKEIELEEEALKKVLLHQTDYTFDEYFPYLHDEPYVHYYDSVAFELDTCKVYRLIPIETADTLYDRIEMIIKSDTLAVNDSVEMVKIDSLELAKPMKLDQITGLQGARTIKSLPKNFTPKLSDSTSMRVTTELKKK